MTWHPGSSVTLETERLFVRDLMVTDITEQVGEWYADPEVVKHMNMVPNKEHAERLKAEVRQLRNQMRLKLGIFCNQTTAMIGIVSVIMDLHNGTAQCDLMIGDRDWWGKNVAIEARGAVIDFLFEQVGMEKVTGLVLGKNLSTLYGYQRLGFTCEGILRRQRLTTSGERVNQYYMGLLKEEWQANKAKQ